jgi:hypothetical protein
MVGHQKSHKINHVQKSQVTSQKKGSHGPQKYAITKTLIIKIVHGKTPMSPT